MEVNPQLQQYYEYLKAAKADVAPTYESFETTLADENSARQYHQYLRDAKFDAPESFESFSETLGLKKKVASEYVYPTAKAFTESVANTTNTLPKDEATTPTEVTTPLETPKTDTIEKPKEVTPIDSVFDKGYEALTDATVKGTHESGEPITAENYITAAPQAFNKRLGEAIRNTVEFINLPQNTLAYYINKFGGKNGGVIVDYMQHAFKNLPIIGIFNKDNVDDVAKAIENAGNPKKIPENIGGSVLSTLGSVAFDIATVRAMPTNKLNALAKYGMERVPMFPTYLAAMGGTTTARETGSAKKTALATAEGAAMGLTYEGMGITAGRIGQLVKELGGGDISSIAARALANSALFEGDTRLKGGEKWTGAITGALFAVPEIQGGIRGEIAKSVAKRAYVSYLTTTDNAIRTISKMNLNPEELRTKSDWLWDEHEKATDPNIKKEALEMKTEVDNLINVNAVTQAIIENPTAFINEINKDTRLSDKEKEKWVAKIKNTVQFADPRIDEAMPIKDKIEELQGGLKDMETMYDDPTIRAEKIKAVEEQIKEQQQLLSKTLSRPLEAQPKYEVMGTPIEKDEALNMIKEAEKIEDLEGMRIQNDPQVEKALQEKFGEEQKQEAPQEDITKKQAVDESLSALEEAVKPVPQVEEVAKPEPIVQETPKVEPIVPPKKKVKNFRPDSRTAIAVNQPANDFTESVLQFFVSGGRISTDDFIAHTGYNRREPFAKGKIELDNYFQLLSKDGAKLDVFNEKLTDSFGRGQSDEGMDMINEVIDIVKKYPNQGAMLRELERRQKGEPQLEPTEEQVRMQEEEILAEAKRKQLSEIYDEKEALKQGLITKEEYDEIYNYYKQQEEQARLAEESIRADEVSDSKGIQEKPVRTTDPIKKKQIDAIDKEYDTKIAEAQKELDGMTEEARRKVITKATAEVNKRNTIFGDANAVQDGVLKPGDQGFVVSKKPIEAALKKFDERKVELTKQIADINKERESKIGEVLKQKTLDFNEPITNEEKANTQPDIKVSTGKEDNIPAGTEPAKGGTVKESEAKPVEPTKVETTPKSKETVKAVKFYDALKKNNAPRIQVRDEYGNERVVFDPASRTEYMDKSDETGRKIRWGAELSDGRVVSLDGLIRITEPEVWAKWEGRLKGMKLENKNEFIIKQTLDKKDFDQLLQETIDFLETEDVYSQTYRGRDEKTGEKKYTTDIHLGKINKLLKDEGHPLAGIFNRELTLKDGTKVNPYQTWLFDLDRGSRKTGGKELPPIEPVKETPPTENKSDLYKSAEKIIAESTPGRVLADLKDLINKATDIKELKTLLKLPIAMEYKSDIASEIYSRRQYIERHPEKFGQGIYSQPTESKAEELKRREEEIKGTGEKKIEVTTEGVKYGDKTYTDIVDVLDDIANGTIKKEDGAVMREEVNKYDDANKPESFANSKTAKQNKRYKNPPNTDKPEELAWDEPMKISTAEDPNFKHSDLNNAMSIRNLGRNLIQNLGLTEGADVRVGFIARFARKARGLFNPRSGIIRVSNVRDLRALTHEIGHKLDFEVFDIRGIISASKTDPLLGTGVDFNGKTYSNVASVEKAMRDHTITIADGNFLLDKVKTFEKDKLAQKYSEIVDASKKKGANLTALRAKYGSAVVDGVLQRATLKKEFMQLLKDINYPKSQQKRIEGIAEFVYNYVADPKQLINSTPNALAWFEKLLDNAPAIKDALHQMRQDYAKYDAQDILTKGVAEMKAPEEVKTPWLDGIVDLKDKMLYSLVNQLQYLEKRVKQWEKLEGVNKSSYKNPWISAKELIGIDGKAQQFLLHNPFLKRGDDIVLRKDIKGLIPIIKHLIGKPEYEIYKSYLVALDAIESHNRQLPRQAYYPKEMALAIKASAEKRYGAAKLMEFQADIQKYNESLLDFAVESGRISKETADYWKREHQNYVPLKRIAEVYEKFKGKKAVTREMIPEAEKAIFARKGSTKTIKDIFESMIENTYSIIGSSERNLHNQNVRDMFQDFHNYNKRTKTGGAVIEEIDARDVVAYEHPVTGEISYSLSKERPSNFKSPKGRILTVFEQGKPRFYDIAPEYYDNIFQSTMETGNLMSKIIRVASAPSRWLQAGAVVLDPTFPVRNVLRDQLSTWFTSKHGYMPTDFIKGIMSALKKDDYYQKWMASGGDQSFLVSADQMISKEYISHTVGSLAQRKFKAYASNPLRALQDFSKLSEIGTRLGAFRNAYKKTGNVHLAAIESRDIAADYGIKGSVSRHFVMFYPFLNARTQWARTSVNAMKSPTFLLKGLAITIPAILNWLNNNQDEESKNLYQSKPTWQRLGFFNIRIPGTDHFFPVPKGFFGTLFGTSIESLLDALVKDDPRVLDGLGKQLFKEISPVGNLPELIPFPMRPPMEAWFNKKGYTGKPIVSESMKMLKPAEQYYNSTPEIIKKMGEALNWSPVKIQHYITSYTGGAGAGAINIMDEVLVQMGLLDQKPEDTFTKLSRMPLFKAFLTPKAVGLQSGYASDFYDTLDKIAKVNVTFNQLSDTKQYDKLDKFMKDPENLRMYQFYDGNSTAINSFRNVMTWIREQGYAIMKDPLLNKQQKQDEVTKINEIVQETLLNFKDAYENKKFFDYGKKMNEIVKKMRDAKKDSRYDVIQQSNLYNPYWMQLREKNTEVFDRLKEFGGMVDIKQTRSISIRGKKVDLELEDVRRFNEEVVQKYGEYVGGRIGTDKETWARDAAVPDNKDPEKTRLEVRLREQWDKASSDVADRFQPTIE